jgi:hypothetical protein
MVISELNLTQLEIYTTLYTKSELIHGVDQDLNSFIWKTQLQGLQIYPGISIKVSIL